LGKERKQARKKEKKKERRRRPKMQIAIENLKTAGAEDYLVIVPARGIQEGRGEDHGGGSGGYGGGDRCYALLPVVASVPVLAATDGRIWIGRRKRVRAC